MRNISRLSRFRAVCIALVFVVASSKELKAQPAPHNSSKSATPEELNPAELQEAFRNVKEQLRSAQIAIVNNRFEFEATARAQAAIIADKIEGMNATLTAEHKARQAEMDRLDFERERQQATIQQSNRSIVWVASAFGAVGLLAMLCAALFQWRAINRMADFIDLRPQLPSPVEHGLLPDLSGAPPGQSTALSTQRLMSTINRMEQRIKELEHTTEQPISPAPSVNPSDRVQETVA